MTAILQGPVERMAVDQDDALAAANIELLAFSDYPCEHWAHLSGD
jgi:hypothetical protein